MRDTRHKMTNWITSGQVYRNWFVSIGPRLGLLKNDFGALN